MTSQKVQKRLSARRGRASPPPPFEVNSNGPTLTPARRLIALGLLLDFLQVHHYNLLNNLAIRNNLRLGGGLDKLPGFFPPLLVFQGSKTANRWTS